MTKEKAVKKKSAKKALKKAPRKARPKSPSELVKMTDEIREFFVQMGRKGGRDGGKLAWAGLSKAERTERARKNALGRRRKKPTSKGEQKS